MSKRTWIAIAVGGGLLLVAILLYVFLDSPEAGAGVATVAAASAATIARNKEAKEDIADIQEGAEDLKGAVDDAALEHETNKSDHVADLEGMSPEEKASLGNSLLGGDDDTTSA
jgi:hypothetical protein